MTFDDLRSANAKRLPDFEAAYKNDLRSQSSWSELEWGGALAGEVGELLNKLKKRLRGQVVPLDDVMREAADVQIYLDLLAQKCGFKLDDAVRMKFNETSAAIGSQVTL